MSIVFWKNLQPNQKESETATHCIRILKEKWSGKLTDEEFEKELAYVAVQPECLSDMEFKELSAKTIEVQTASEALEKEKQSLRANEVLDMGAFHKAHPCLMDYSEKVDGETRANQRNAEELESLHKYFSKVGDTVSIMKVHQAYQTYPRSLWVGSKMVWERKKI